MDVMDAHIKVVTDPLVPGFQVVNIGQTETATIQQKLEEV